MRLVVCDNCLTGTGGYFDGMVAMVTTLISKMMLLSGLMDNQWSISVWVNADEDMDKFSSVFSTTAKNMEADTGDGWVEWFSD